MRLSVALTLASVIFLTDPVFAADSRDGTPVARISYNNSYARYGNEPGSPRICLALFADGYYQISKVRPSGETVRLQGVLSKEQTKRLRNLVDGLEFRDTSAGALREGSESLIVEITEAEHTLTHRWIDQDHQTPFPISASRLVEWLQNFKAQGATRLTVEEMIEPSICPPASMKPLAPTVAELTPAFDEDSCAGPIR